MSLVGDMGIGLGNGRTHTQLVTDFGKTDQKFRGFAPNLEAYVEKGKLVQNNWHGMKKY